MKISAKTVGLRSNEPLVIMKCTCKVSMNKILFWYIWKIDLPLISLPTHWSNLSSPHSSQFWGRLLTLLKKRAPAKGTLFKISNSSLHKKTLDIITPTFWGTHTPDQYFLYENQCGCYKKLASRMWPHAIYTYQFSLYTYTFLFCWKIKNCDCCDELAISGLLDISF